MSARTASHDQTLAGAPLPRLRFTALLCGSVLLASWIPAKAQEWEAAIRAGDYERAEVELERALETAPDDPTLRYHHARVLALAGANEAALAGFDALLADYPNDADYLLGRAQMLARLGDDAAAARSAERALNLAPDYEDVWRLRLGLADRSGDAELAASVRAESMARFPGATWWQRADPPRAYSRWL